MMAGPARRSALANSARSWIGVSSHPAVPVLGPDGPYWMFWRGALHSQERLRGWTQAVLDTP